MGLMQLAPRPNIGAAIGSGLAQGMADVAKMGLQMKLNDMLQQKEERRILNQNARQAEQFTKSFPQYKGMEGLITQLGMSNAYPLLQMMSDEDLSRVKYGQSVSGLMDLPGMNVSEAQSQQPIMQPQPIEPSIIPPDRRSELAEPMPLQQGQQLQQQQLPKEEAFQPPKPTIRFQNRPIGQLSDQEFQDLLYRTPQNRKDQLVKERSRQQAEQRAVRKDLREERAEGREQRKEDRKFMQESMKASDAGSIVGKSLSDMKEIRERGNLGPQSLVTRAASPQTRSDIAAYNSNASNILNLYKTMFPRGITQVEFERISKDWVPNSKFTDATNEARESVFQEMVDQIKKKNDIVISLQNPDGSFPENLQAKVNKQMHEEEKSLKEKLLSGPPDIEIGSKFETMPDVKQFKIGDVIKDDKTGQEYISTGKSWRKK